MKKPIYGVIAVVLLGAGVAAFAIVYGVRGAGPVFDAPQIVDFGVQEQGANVSSAFTIRNRGRAVLVMDRFRTSCGCLTIERETASGFERLEQASLEPGDELTVNCSIRIPGDVGARVREVIRFRTNDPSNEEASVELAAEVNGRIIAVPNRIDFGQVVVGQTAVRAFEVRNTGRRSLFAVRDIRSTAPDVVRVRSVNEGEEGPATGATVGNAVCRAEVKLHAPHRPGALRCMVEILSEDQSESEPVITIPVLAVVVPRFQLLPASLLLPRISEGGPVFEGRVICKATSGQASRVQIKEVPPGLVVDVEESIANGSQSVVRVKSQSKDMPFVGERSVKLVASDQENMEVLELPVTCWRAK